MVRDGKNEVFVVSDGVARETPVTVGLSSATLTEVAAGVPVGAAVVVQGQDNLVNGDHVSVANAT